MGVERGGAEPLVVVASSARRRAMFWHDTQCRARGHKSIQGLGRFSWAGLALVLVGCLGSGASKVATHCAIPSRMPRVVFEQQQQQQQQQQRSGGCSAASPTAHSSGFLAGPKAALFWSHRPRTTWRRSTSAVAVTKMFDSSYRNYFEVLGVQPQDDLQTIKKAYRKLCLQNHPDTCNEADSKEKFQLINEAYNVLSDNSRKWMHAEGLGMHRHSRNLQKEGRDQVWKTTRYVVGDVIGHLEDGWEGVILGVDEVCRASQQWMDAHRVHKLKNGKNQRFFHVLLNLPETEAMTLSRDFKSGSKVIFNEPAFFMTLGQGGKDMETPTLHTIYVSEDEIYHWRFSGGEGRHETSATGRSFGNSAAEHSTLNGPVKNSLLHEIFSHYRRGRYGHDGKAFKLTFTRVVS